MKLTESDLREIDGRIQGHYEETMRWCEEMGFPTFWMKKPETMESSTPRQYQIRPENKRRPADGTHRNHRQGHGWKANHQS